MMMMIKIKKIDIKKDFTAEERMTRDGGEKLRTMILTNQDSVSIDFHHKPIASVSFWDESIAKLLLFGWSVEEIRKKIEFKNIHHRDEPIIEKLLKARSKS